jgi:hypothetical protein
MEESGAPKKKEEKKNLSTYPKVMGRVWAN